jgi:hypothetical protein
MSFLTRIESFSCNKWKKHDVGTWRMASLCPGEQPRSRHPGKQVQASSEDSLSALKAPARRGLDLDGGGPAPGRLAYLRGLGRSEDRAGEPLAGGSSGDPRTKHRPPSVLSLVLTDPGGFGKLEGH